MNANINKVFSSVFLILLLSSASAVFSNAYALGLGKLQVESNLGEPFNANIELVLDAGQNAQEVNAALASLEDFQQLGIDYPEYIKSIGIEPYSKDGQWYLGLSSDDVAFSEPFVHLLIRVDWADGSFIREYTALIDPPLYADKTPEPVSMPVAVDEPMDSGVKELQSTEPAMVDDILALEPEIKVNENVQVQSANAEVLDGQYGPIAQGETLSGIAADLKKQFPDLTIYQIMMMLFNENKNAFINNNINGLLKGVVLEISDINKIRTINKNDALTFFAQHVNDWSAYQEGVAVNDSSAEKVKVSPDSYVNDNAENSAQTSESGNESQDKDFKNFRVGAAGNEQSQLSDGDKSNGELVALNNKLTTTQTELQSSNLENQELKERITILEQQVADMNRLVELSVADAEMENVESTLAKQNDATQAESAITPVVEPDQVESEPLAVNSKSEKAGSNLKSNKKVSDENSFSKQLIAIGVGLLGLIGFLVYRRLNSDDEFATTESYNDFSTVENDSTLDQQDGLNSISELSDSDAKVTDDLQASQLVKDEVLNDENSFLSAFSENSEGVHADEVDPIAEADVYIAYGREEQAEEVLIDSMEHNPERLDIKMKLLELYHGNKNTSRFEHVAQQMYADDIVSNKKIWPKIAQMGKTLSPNNPLFNVSSDDLNMVEKTEKNLEASSAESKIETRQKDEQSKDEVSSETELSDETIVVDENIITDEESDADVSNNQSWINDEDDNTLINFAINLSDDEQNQETISPVNVDNVNFDTEGLGETKTNQHDDENEEDDFDIDINITDNLVNKVDNQSVSDEVKEPVSELDTGLTADDTQASGSVISETLTDQASETKESYDESNTQFDLAQVFVDLGDEDGAKAILNELISSNEVSPDVIDKAKKLLASFG